MSWRTRRRSIATAAVAVAALLHASTPAYSARPGRPRPRREPDQERRRQANPLDLLRRTGAPEVAFQFRPCLADEQRRKVLSSLRKALKAAGTGDVAEPDVRSRCSAVDLGTETVGVWRSPVARRAYPPGPDPIAGAARDGVLLQVDLLEEGELFAGRIGYPLLASLANRAWEAQPKRLDDHGREDSHGPIHLRSFSFAFGDGNEVRTRVGGYYQEGPISADFVYRMADVLSVQKGALHAESTQNVDVDETPVTLVMVALTAIFPPLGVLGLKWLVEVWEHEADPPDPGTSVGAMLMQILPSQLMTSDGRKVVFTYGRLRLAANEAVLAGGTFSSVARDPRVAIEGPRDVWTFRGDPPHHVTYKARTQDLRPALRGAWTLDGRATDPPLTGQARLAPRLPDLDPTSEGITFQVPRIATGSSVTQRVAVTVTDVDGLAARAAIDVRVHLDDRQHPAICRQKPWLPQCRNEPRR